VGWNKTLKDITKKTEEWVNIEMLADKSLSKIDLIKEFFDVNDEIRIIRDTIFREEQNIPYDKEYDSDENRYIHLCFFVSNKIIAYARVLFEKNGVIISRIAVLHEYRYKGYGSEVLQIIENKALDNKCHFSELDAQTQAIKFYETNGYDSIGNVHLEAGIPHIKMRKTLLQGEM